MSTRCITRTLLLAALAMVAVACREPVEAYDDSIRRSPDYRPFEECTDADEYCQPSSGERGNVMTTEIGWAGSVSNAGDWDPDDVFIEFQNKNPRPINISRWQLTITGDVIRTYVLPSTTTPIQPNDFYVIAAKADGAFGAAADMIVPELRIGKSYVHIELRDADLRLIEGAGSDSQRVFVGGWDTYTTRSMERVQLIFGNRGNQSRSWHAFSEDRAIGLDEVFEGAGVHPDYVENTLASPGLANSRDYSGSSSSGGFE